MADITNSSASSNVNRKIGREAQTNNIMAAKVVADIVKTTLGPKGMDKMLVDAYGNITITNDGVTILREMEIDHPAAKMLIDIAVTQEKEVGDGTTSAVILAGRLLENGEKLMEQKIHPTSVLKGYDIARAKSVEILNNISVPIENKEMLHKIAMTAMTGKGAEQNRERLSKIIAEAVDLVSEGNYIDKDLIKVQKLRSGKVEESEIIKGIILEKGRAHIDMPKRITGAKILLVDFPIELRSPENESRLNITSPEQLESFVLSEEKRIKDIVEKIINSKANMVLCQKGIDDVAQYYLASAGVMCVRRVTRSNMEKVSRASSGKIISNVNELSGNILGKAGIVEEIKDGDDNLLFIKECENPKAVTILLKGSSEHALEENRRAIDDALGDIISVVQNRKVVAGGGAVEIELARKLREYARTLIGNDKTVVEVFASSIEVIPETLADNAGMNSKDVLSNLRNMHEQGSKDHGLNLLSEKIEDNMKAGVIEPLKVKLQAINSAAEVAQMLLRIDDVLISKGKDSKEERLNYSEMQD